MLAVFAVTPNTGDTIPTVVVPYVEGSPTFEAVKLNLAAQGLKPRLYRMQGDFDYDLMVRKLWAEGQPFCIVEHDIVPWPGALVQMWECEHSWCGLPYLVHGQLRSYLGCVKFVPAKLGAVPLPEMKEGLVSWQHLDKMIQQTLLARSNGEVREHRHGPAVSHLNFSHARTTSSCTVHPRFWTDETLSKS